MKIACQSSLFLFLLHITIRANKIVNSNLQHIIALIAAIFISAALHATNLNKERLTLLQPLVEHDLSFNTNIDITTDSIILWEKLLSPELEKQQEYHILFPLKMMAVQALITEGNISLAVNNANSMYQQAKAIDYPFGTALALRALADTYQSSGNPQSAIESYEESLKIMQKIPASIPYLKTSMFHLILSKLKYRQMTDIEKDFAYLESLYHKESGLPDDFYLPCSYAYYYIQTNNLPKALEYLKQLDSIYEKYPYPYYSSISNYMYAGYHIESKEYDKALKEYEELLTITKKTALFRHVQLLQERAKVLVLMNQKQEACKIYDSAKMTLEEVLDVMRQAEKDGQTTVRLHTGDPCIYGAIREQMDVLDAENISYDYCPGVSSFCGAASALNMEYTLPGVSQSVIITRMAGRTPVPEKEEIASFAAHQATMVVFLSTGMLEELSRRLIEGGYTADTPAAIVYKATWEDEKKFVCTVGTLAQTAKDNNITKTALMIIGDCVKAAHYDRSKLYDPEFTTEFRKGTK